MIPTNPDHELMILAAFRYCIGRATYIVPVCTAWLQEVWPHLGEQSQQQLIKEIDRAIETGRAGHDCDERDWQLLLDWMVKELPSQEINNGKSNPRI